MSGKNGLTVVQAIDLGDLSPRTAPVNVTRDGYAVTLDAYVDGPQCPGFVKAKVASARKAYQAATNVPKVGAGGNPVLDDKGEPVVDFVEDDEAWNSYLRDALRAIIPGLTHYEAEVLAGRQTVAMSTLRGLGWVRSEAEDEDASPEVPGEKSTTDDSSPDSQRSTTSRRKRS